MTTRISAVLGIGLLLFFCHFRINLCVQGKPVYRRNCVSKTKERVRVGADSESEGARMAISSAYMSKAANLSM